jgi:negative regulator of sigma E activity
MKYNDKNNDMQDDLEMDELNIKSHLNTSLDLSGISVSEDLINRTLAAIEAQPADNEEQKVGSETIGNKVIPWNRYVRGFAGVAAAVLIVAVGYNVVKQVPFGSQKDSANSSEMQEKSSYDTLVAEPTEQDINSTSMEEAATTSDDSSASSGEVGITDTKQATDTESSVQYTITAADAPLAVDGGEGVTASESEAGTTDVAKADEGTVEPKLSTSMRNSDVAVLLSFREIFLPDPTKAEYITITDEINKTSVTLTDQKAILDFYSVMDNHQFTNGAVNPTDQNYTVELKSPDPEALYTLFVGDNLIVRYSEGDVVVENIYDAVDKDLLKQNLDELYQKYNE